MNHPEIERLTNRYRDLSACRASLADAFRLLSGTFERGGIVLACGNGAGSSAAEQFVTGLLRGFQRARPVTQAFADRLIADHGTAGELLASRLQGSLPAIALTGPGSLLSGIAAGIDPELIYAQQVYGYAREGDTLVAVAAGGATANLLAALRTARSLGLETLVLSGRDAGREAELADVAVLVPRITPPEIQELHQPVLNTLVTMLEQQFFS